ncbi:hypothetical protein [Leptolyngbya sp. FACHB-261]|uniref:hypothetical protein n=1 Tax=Leptolyngbya sp. FACHB-261 TaxID=2692806 RepID=UPI001684A772|nr:hypothetical protein [Leptolyngbya sp. FACHB-261]MBD2103329.1 hypothetical protein [Leptolyngbya sp. FACHB-261]
MFLKRLLPRLGLSCAMLATLPFASDSLLDQMQAPDIFGGIATIASCLGASVPMLKLFGNSNQNSEP